jgi:predicted nucleic-acid-binding Zn-ribbon protein
MNKPVKYTCPKCGSKNFTTGQIRTTGNFLTSFLNIQYKHFTTVICNVCSYTELYRLPLKKLADVIDLPQDI